MSASGAARPSTRGNGSGVPNRAVAPVQGRIPLSKRPQPAQVVPALGRSSITFEKHGNLAYSTVATAPSPASTGLTMVLNGGASTFPSPTAPGALPYSVTVWPAATQPTQANSEIVTFTALDPGTLTVTMVRAQEFSTARTIVAGDQVELTHTVLAMTQHEDAILGLDGRVGAIEQGPVTTYAAVPPLTARTGDFWGLLADPALGVNWTFRYRGDSASTFKWEFIGGPALYAELTVGENTTSTSYAEIVPGTVGPSLTVPRAGVYEIMFACQCSSAAGSASGACAVKLGAATAVDTDGSSQGTAAPPAPYNASMARTINRTLAAGDVVTLQYKVNQGTGQFLNRNLQIRPVRVA